MNDSEATSRWYSGITGYQWTVLVIASLGWVFDVFEGQIFVASMNEAMPALLPPGTDAGGQKYYANLTFAAFLCGGAVGGVLFGALSDRFGRARMMIFTIVVYSAFTALSALAQTWWQLAIMRFLVALGVGGEWAVASSLVAEVFPPRARAWSLSIFHASSVLGTLLAIAAGKWIVGNESLGWRAGFLVGVLPALLIIWIRLSLKEPPRTAAPATDAGRIGALFESRWLRHTLVGTGLAAIGLATFWGVHIYGKDLMLDISGLKSSDDKAARKSVEMLGMLLVTLGGGLGLVSFGPISERIGRRAAFLVYHLLGFATTGVAFGVLGQGQVSLAYVLLPVFGFWTLGMHAGYAVYFPELFPTRLRGAGAGFCFNVGRILAAPCLFLAGWLQTSDGAGWSLTQAVVAMSGLYLVGAVLLLFAPETRGRELPE